MKTEVREISASDHQEEILKPTFKPKIAWRNVFLMIIGHLIAIRGVYGSIFGNVRASTLVWFWFCGSASAFGVLAGAHRLWSHKAYKAKFPLRVLLMILDTLALQNDIYEWSRDHRVHHKYSETDADPHNSHRGFFFSHMGWLLCTKHPEVKAKGKTVDLSDLWADPVVRFQRRFYIPLVLLIWGFIPMWVPYYFWGESWFDVLCGNMLRYFITLHHAWTVNSFAHISGMRPYDATMGPRENRGVAWASFGEGYHNYHHVFPWDYSASEYGWRVNCNPATFFIDFFAKFGWAYDLKKPTEEMVRRREERTGDSKDKKLHQKMNWSLDLIGGALASFWPLILIFTGRLLVSCF